MEAAGITRDGTRSLPEVSPEFWRLRVERFRFSESALWEVYKYSVQTLSSQRKVLYKIE